MLFQVPLTSSELVVDEMTYFMYKFEELKESFYCPEKCAKAFPSCQKGYDQLSHGLLQVLKMARSVVRAKEDLDEMKSVVKKIGSVDENRKICWSENLIRSLKKLSEFVSRSTSILAKVSETDDGRMFEISCDVASLKKESEKASSVLADYSKSVEVLAAVASGDSTEAEDLMRENVEKLRKSFEKLSADHPTFTSGILLQLESLHSEVVSKIVLRLGWKSWQEAKLRPLPGDLVSKFEVDVKSASLQCLVAIQEASKCIKKLDLVEDEDDSGFMISAFDRAVAGLRGLKVASVLSDFRAISGFVALCESRNFDVRPLVSRAKMFAPIFDVYVSFVQSLIRHSESMGLVTCRYLAQCCSVLKAFLLYDFGKIEQEDGQDGKTIFCFL